MASNPESFYELYRRSSIGMALMDMLDDLISVERIYPQLAMKILANFDQAITEALQKSVRARLTFKVSSKQVCVCQGTPEPSPNAFPSSSVLASLLVHVEGKTPGTEAQERFMRIKRWLICTGGAALALRPSDPLLQGSLSTYRFCDEVWTFLIKNVQFKLDSGGQIVHADKVKIVSCNAKKPGEGA